MGYIDREKARMAAREQYKDHEAAHHAFWNASAEELKELCETWDKIKAYGVPKDLLDDLFHCGYTAGADNADFDHAENDQ